ncbi:MAG TPA: ion transporter [Vicinamibacterales bacterium]|nr:ion transporter [Vicinamibacterales bacterium]
MPVRLEAKPSTGYQIFMLMLCVYSLASLAFQVSQPHPETMVILHYADWLVCAAFIVDFVVSLLRAPDRWRYFRTWGWLDLVSSIPTIDLVRWGRVARILRIVRVMRGLRASRVLTSLVIEKRAENALMAASLIAFMLITFCSIAILKVEVTDDANIKTAADAVWWSFGTITTVGPGDNFPVTGEGRIIAAILMAAGIGLFGTFSAFLASWFIGEDGDESQAEIAKLRREIASLREVIEKRS